MTDILGSDPKMSTAARCSALMVSDPMSKRLTAFTFLAMLGVACTSEKSGESASNKSADPTPKPEEAAKPLPPLSQLGQYLAAVKIDKTKPDWKTRLPAPPTLLFDDKKYYWNIVTDAGELKILLHTKLVPRHCSNAIYLTELGFYDGLTFHRVIKGFMAQGGDPVGNGSGTPGYSIHLEVHPTLKHDKRGVVSTARRPDPNSAGSQFFIMFAEKKDLDMQYTVFGQTVAGMSTIDALEDVGSRDPQAGTPTSIITIKKATITAE